MDSEYERPREKLRHRGVTSLTMTELLQVIIGAGSARVSAAKLSRKVEKLMERAYTYEDLISIRGLGDAKASQLVAAVEIGARIASVERAYKKAEEGQFPGRARERGAKGVTCFMLNGSGQELRTLEYPWKSDTRGLALARQILADAVAASAHGVVVCFYTPDWRHTPPVQVLSLIRALRRGSRQLTLRFLECYAYGKDGHTGWKREAPL